MTSLRSLILIASTANASTVVLYNYTADQPGGSGAAMAFSLLWMPVIWTAAIVLAIFISIKRRKNLFNAGKTKWTIAILLFCTPLPIYLVYRFTHPVPDTLRSSTSYTLRNGKIFKTESWHYTSADRPKYVDMLFVADSSEEAAKGEAAFEKDSLWIYFTPSGDTLKVERYHRGLLIPDQKPHK